MKITRRSDKGKGGHLLISVPASRVAEVEAALTFLKEKPHQRGSQVVIDLIIRVALRNGWTPPATWECREPPGPNPTLPTAFQCR